MSTSAQEVSIFAKGGFVARAARQHRNKDLLPDFLNADLVPCQFAVSPVPNNPPVKCELLGTYPGYGYSQGRTIHCWAVTLQSGLRVSAYSFGGTYNVCQHTGFMAHQGE